jgi:lipopolysaccharide export system protein LptA
MKTGINLLLAAALAGSLYAESEPGRSTEITADRLEFDYKRSIAVFRENVVAKDPEIEIRADELRVLFRKDNRIKSVTALGQVTLKQADRTGTCRKAVYLEGTGQVILTGDARLRRGKDFVEGDVITFHVNEERVTCVPGRLLIFPQGETNRTSRPFQEH